MSGQLEKTNSPAVPSELTANAVENVLVKGDLAGLSSKERVNYYGSVCKSVGLNPLTRPFEYIKLNGKLTLYAKRDCTDQLRSVNGVSVIITDRTTIDGIYIVTARATNAKGRQDESTGAVSLGNLKGEALANAYMKAETKAKRRVTLSICGLGLLDETEAETIRDAEFPKDVISSDAEPLELGDFYLNGKTLKGKLKDLDNMDLARALVDMEELLHNFPDHPSASAVKRSSDAINEYLLSIEVESSASLDADDDGLEGSPEDVEVVSKPPVDGANYEEQLPSY